MNSTVSNQSAPNRKYKKRIFKNYLIYPRFQLALIAANVATLLFSFLFVGIQSMRSYDKLREIGRIGNIPSDHSYYRFIDAHEQNLYQYLLIAVVVSTILSALCTLMVSHRFAGPLVRLRGYFRSIGDGKPLTPLSFRKGDFFSDLPALVNKALTKIQGK